jgi:hypothetical protein
VAAPVEAHVEGPLQHETDDSRDEEREGQRREERHAVAVHQDGGDVAAGHSEGAVREVDEVHQPERHGEPAGQHEQEHAVGDAVEEDGQQRLDLPAVEAPWSTAPQEQLSWSSPP